MAMRRQPQLSMDEQRIDDPDILAALEEREKRHNSLSAVRQAFDEANEKASAELAKLELPVGAAVRVGPYRVERRHVPQASVAFDRKATTRIRISRTDEG